MSVVLAQEGRSGPISPTMWLRRWRPAPRRARSLTRWPSSTGGPICAGSMPPNAAPRCEHSGSPKWSASWRRGSSSAPEGGSASEAQARLLSTATRIFYAGGNPFVADRPDHRGSEGDRATLYRYFAGKEELVLAYLDEADQGIRGQVTAAQASSPSARSRLSPDPSPTASWPPVSAAVPSSTRQPNTLTQPTPSTDSS